MAKGCGKYIESYLLTRIRFFELRFDGIEAGILGVIGLCAVFILAFRLLSQASRQTEDLALKSLYWSLGCTLVGVIAAWQGVSFFGQMNALFYCILGIIGSSFALAKEGLQHQLLNTGNNRYQYSAQEIVKI